MLLLSRSVRKGFGPPRLIWFQYTPIPRARHRGGESVISLMRLTVPAGSEAVRLDRFLRDAVPSVPVRSIRYALESGAVSVDGKRAPKGAFLRAGQVVALHDLPEASDWLPVPGDLPAASVRFRDEWVAVLEKPAGVQTEPVGPNEKGTLAGFYAWKFPDAPLPADTALLSRLDRETSGLVLAALDEPSLRALLRERAAGRIEKRYVCRVAGRIGSPIVLRGSIDSKGGRRVRVDRESPETDSRYWTRISPVGTDGNTTRVEAGITKGKRHQIRAHLAAEGHPIVGDPVYGEGCEGSGRLLLHAAELRFVHPATGETVTVRSPLPEGFGF